MNIKWEQLKTDTKHTQLAKYKDQFLFVAIKQGQKRFVITDIWDGERFEEEGYDSDGNLEYSLADVNYVAPFQLPGYPKQQDLT